MSNGWEGDGSPRLFCDLVADEIFVPATFMGYEWASTPHSPALPSITIGTSDFSMEVWALRRYGNSPGNDEIFQTGLLKGIENVGRPFLTIVWDGNSDAAGVSFDSTPPFTPEAGIAITPPTRKGVWNLYQVNCDRDGLMEFFIDLESKGTVSIAAFPGALAAAEFHPLTSDHGTLQAPDTPLEDWFFGSGGPAFPVMVGPIAVHKRLLTAAELNDSFMSKTVQSLGSATTLVRYNWTNFEGDIGWDSELDRCPFVIRAGLQVPVAMPQGALGTVKVLDTSGNDLHWNLPTVVDYTTYNAVLHGGYSLENGRWPMAFGRGGVFR